MNANEKRDARILELWQSHKSPLQISKEITKEFGEIFLESHVFAVLDRVKTDRYSKKTPAKVVDQHDIANLEKLADEIRGQIDICHQETTESEGEEKNAARKQMREFAKVYCLILRTKASILTGEIGVDASKGGNVHVYLPHEKPLGKPV